MSSQAVRMIEQPITVENIVFKPPYPFIQTVLSDVGVVITDQNVEISYVNQAFTMITGYQLQDVLGKNPKILQSGYHDASFYQTMWCSVDETGQWRGKVIDRRKDGAIYLEQLHIIAMKNDRNEINGYIGILSDISELQALEWQHYHIEDLREQLYTLAIAKGIIDAEVISISQKLDKMLNTYHSQINKNLY